MISNNNPVRELLRAAAQRDLTRTDLERLDAADADLPPGESLSRFRPQVTQGARQVRELGLQGRNAEARRLADDITAQVSSQMTRAERESNGAAPSESLEDLARRMFGR